MQEHSIPPGPPDLSQCDQEPIHRPGAIQPQGVLLALAGDALEIRQVSATCLDLLGREPAQVLGQPLGSLLGEDLAAAVRSALRQWRARGGQPASFDWAHREVGRRFWGAVHESAGNLVLELEDAGDAESEPGRPRIEAVLERLARVRAEPDLITKLESAVVLFRELTGYDRVMAYRFDSDWHGEVVAESRRDDLEPFLGLHYPASDIPPQARRLYCISPTRLIVDVRDRPAPLIPPLDGHGGDPLDLSLCLLRAVSPVHLEFLENMGVRATLTASLVQDGKLWGLIACHHLTPRRLPRLTRNLVGWLAQDLSTQIALCEESARRATASALEACRTRVVKAMRAGARLADLVRTAGPDDLLGAAVADGVALVQGGQVTTGGIAPEPGQVLAISALCERLPERLREEGFATDRLGQRLPEAADWADRGAGVLALALGGEPAMKLLWFRGERLRSVTWGGDPRGAVTVSEDGRISPRKSFAAWKELVRGQSLPWSPLERASAAELRSVIDIELRHGAETALRDREIQLQSILDNAPVVIFIKDLAGRYLKVNRYCEALLGVSDASLAGKTPDEVFPPDIAAGFMANDRALIESLAPQSVEEVVGRGHDRRILLSHQFPLRDHAGRAVAICGISLDITERRRMERELEVALGKYRTLFDAFPLGITVADAEGRLVEANAAAGPMLGIATGSRAETALDTRTRNLSLTRGAPSAGDLPAPGAVPEAGAPTRSREVGIGRDDGGMRWLSVTSAPLPPAGEEVVSVYEDITQRKADEVERRAESTRRESARRFRDLADQLPVMAWQADPDGSLTFVNRTSCEYFGLPEAAFFGQGWLDLIHPDDRDGYGTAFLDTTAQGSDFQDQCRMRRADGQWRWIETQARVVLDGDRRPLTIVGSSRDITERKSAEEALAQSHRDLVHRTQQLGRLTSELTLAEHRERERIAKVLHDHLQQLLVGATFGIDRAAKRCESQIAAEEVTAALDSARDMLREAVTAARSLVADLSPPILHEGGLPDALRWLARLMRERYGLIVTLDLARDLSPAREDVRRLVFESAREALFNVVKHGQCQEATVRLRRDGADRMRLVIADRGRGFDTARQLGAGGETGFGLLSMSERLRFLGGACSIDSAPGRGTRVTLLAPLEAPVAESAETASGSRAASAGLAAATEPSARARTLIRVLLVDDHPMVRQGLAAVLEDEPDLEVVGEASNGVDAISQVERLRPDVVLMDYSMPEMDGLEATRRITERWPEQRVIGLSMYEEQDRGRAMLEAGAGAYLSKTGDTNTLLATIRRQKAEDFQGT